MHLRGYYGAEISDEAERRKDADLHVTQERPDYGTQGVIPVFEVRCEMVLDRSMSNTLSRSLPFGHCERSQLECLDEFSVRVTWDHSWMSC